MSYSSTSLVVVRGFWDEKFCLSKPRTYTEEPRTKEGPIKADLRTKLELLLVIWWALTLNFTIVFGFKHFQLDFNHIRTD